MSSTKNQLQLKITRNAFREQYFVHVSSKQKIEILLENKEMIDTKNLLYIRYQDGREEIKSNDTVLKASKCTDYIIKKIINKKCPFTNREGSSFGKYDCVAKFNTIYSTEYFYLKKKTCDLKKIKSLFTCLRNDYFVSHQQNSYRILSIIHEASELTFTSGNKKEKFLLTNNKNNKGKICKFHLQPKQTKNFKYVIAFDCETIFIKHLNKHICYCLVAKCIPIIAKQFTNIEKDVTDLEKKDTYEAFIPYQFESDFDTFICTLKHIDSFKLIQAFQEFIAKNFCNWLIDNFLKPFDNCDFQTNIRLVGFNNNNFDNHFIINCLRQLPGVSMDYRQRYTKMTSLVFYKPGIYNLEIVDLCKWIPDASLRKACLDYQTSTQKLDFDIVTYNHLCEEKGKFIRYSRNLTKYLKDADEDINWQEDNFFSKYWDTEKQMFCIWDIMTKYCEIDVQAVSDLYIKLNDTVVEIIDELEEKCKITIPSNDFLFYISIPHMAFAIFKAITTKQLNFKLEFFSTEQYRFIFESYFGGRCDYAMLGEYNAINELYYYDVTSEYPLAMKGYFPYIENDNIDDNVLFGDAIDINKIQKFINCACKERQMAFENKVLHSCSLAFLEFPYKGIFKCNVKAPLNSFNLINFGPIGQRTYENGIKVSSLHYPNTSRENIILNTTQIKQYIFCGWTVEVLQCENNMLFKRRAKLFEEFIDIVGKMKAESKHTNKSKSKLMKMIMNSCAGKLAQKPENRYIEQFIKNNTLISHNDYTIEEWQQSLHYLATFLLAEANFILFKCIYTLQLQYIYYNIPLERRIGSLLYCDTDSIIFDKDVANTDLYNFVIDEQLGCWDEIKCEFKATWKREHADTKLVKCIILRKKCYSLFAENNENVDLKLKGIHKEMIKKYFNYETLKSVCCDVPKTVTFNSLLKKRKQNDVLLEFYEADIRKTLSIDRHPLNQRVLNHLNVGIVYEKNRENFEQTLFKKILFENEEKEREIYNFLQFYARI